MNENTPFSQKNTSGGLPQPDTIPEKARAEASGAYIMMFSGLYLPIPLIEVVMSLVYYNYWKRESRFHAFHCHQAMISQLPVSILNNGLLVWIIVLIVRFFKGLSGAESEVTLLWSSFTAPRFVLFFWTVIALNLIYIVLSLIAYRRAAKGRFFYFPLFGEISYNRFFGPDAVTFNDKRNDETPNLPPGSTDRD